MIDVLWIVQAFIIKGKTARRDAGEQHNPFLPFLYQWIHKFKCNEYQQKSFLIFLFAFLLAGMYVTAQNPYRWTDELELLKRVDKLPEYRTGSYVEQFSSYDRTWGNDDGFAGTYSFLRKEGITGDCRNGGPWSN